MNDNFLQVKNLQKQYSSLNINVSFSIKEGNFTTILGQSGSGKTTILRLLAGLEKSDSNDTTIILDNKNITKSKPSERNIGMVFQDGALFLNMNVLDNITYGLRCQGIKKKQANIKALSLMQAFEIEHLAKQFPETLSGGEIQRVALARTLIVQPKLILFDEPLSALDSPLRKKLGNDIKQLQKLYGFTAIMVTHDIGEAKALSDQIIFINKGSITYNGNVEDFSEQQYLL